jgi:hypothetical protein
MDLLYNYSVGHGKFNYLTKKQKQSYNKYVL